MENMINEILEIKDELNKLTILVNYTEKIFPPSIYNNKVLDRLRVTINDINVFIIMLENIKNGR